MVGIDFGLKIITSHEKQSKTMVMVLGAKKIIDVFNKFSRMTCLRNFKAVHKIFLHKNSF